MSPISFIRISGASLIIYFVAISYSFSGVLLVANYMFLFSVYLGMLWVSKEINKEDIEVVKNMIPIPILSKL